jgi:hypothetical protein
MAFRIRNFVNARVRRHTMKSVLPLLLLLFLTSTLLAQKSIQFSNESDTAFWYRYKNDNIKQFKLGFIENDTTDYSFRFWSFGLVIKVTDKGSGEIIRFVEAYPNDKSRSIFVKRYPISSTSAFQIKRLIDSLQIEALPSDKNIKSWEQGLDGVTYFTEYKKGGQYSFKNYWTPTSQDTLKEAIQFQNFVSGLDRLLDLRKNNKEFEADIPFDSWSYPGSATAVLRINPKPKKKNGG